MNSRLRLSDIVLIIGGGTPRTQNKEYWDGNIPWISVADMGSGFRYIEETAKHISEKGLKESSTKLLLPGDVIISARGTVGVINQIRTPMAFNQTCYGLRAFDKIVDSNYLYYLLLKQVPELQQIGHGAVFNTITKDSFEQIAVDLPPLETQKDIAHILGTLDDKIELNRKMNKILEEIAQTLFKHWFIDFEFPNDEGKPYKSSSGEMIDSELGPIPKGWRIGTIGDLCSFEYGKSLTSTVRNTGKYPVMGSNGQIGWHDEALVSGPGVVIGRKGNPGIIKWVHNDFYPIDTTFYAVVKSKILMRYLYFALLQADLKNLSADSAVPGLNREAALTMKVIIPSEEVLNAFGSWAENLTTQKKGVDNQNDTLTTVRDTLLKELLNSHCVR